MVKTAKSEAFTLIEMLVVVFIIGILATLVGPRVMKLLTGGERSATQATMATLKTAVVQYRSDMGHLPKKLDELVNKPTAKGSENWDGPYLDAVEVPMDRWNNEFEYNCPPVKHKNKYRYFEILSPGPEGENKPLDIGS